MGIPYLIEFLFIISFLAFAFALMLIIPTVMEALGNRNSKGDKRWQSLVQQYKHKVKKAISHLQKKRPGTLIFELAEN